MVDEKPMQEETFCLAINSTCLVYHDVSLDSSPLSRI